MKLQICRLLIAGSLFAVGSAPALAVTYYVNDGSTTGDMYCSVIGNDANTGMASNAPVLSLATLISKYTLQPGDTVYIDTGSYAGGTHITAFGTAANPITLIGSTNGTVFTAQGSAGALSLSGEFLHVQHCVFELTSGPFLITGLSNSVVMYSTFRNAGGWGCVRDTGSNLYANNFFRNCLFSSNQSVFIYRINSLTVENCIFLNNTRIDYAFSAAVLNVNNSIVYGGRVLTENDTSMQTSGSWKYNLFIVHEGIYGQIQYPEEMAVLNTNWHHNATVSEIGFVSSSISNFHLVPSSPAIDFGNPSHGVGAEPAPNGGRINVGLYGGTSEATPSPTNPWLRALSYDAGGLVMGTGVFVWACGNLPSDARVDLEFTRDEGVTWETIVNGVVATNEQFFWVPSVLQETPAALWRIKSSTNAAIASTNSTYFGVKTSLNTGFTYYVNGDSLSNTRWCTQMGDDDATGTTPATPMRTVSALFARYALRAGDIVYIDTGHYQESPSLGKSDFGNPNKALTIIGNGTNTLFAPLSGSALSVAGSFIHLQDIVFTSSWTTVAMLWTGNSNEFSGIILDVTGGWYGIQCNGTGNILRNSLVRGPNLIRSTTASRDFTLINSIFSASSVHIYADGVDDVVITNCIFTGTGRIFGNVLCHGDYNIIDEDVPISASTAYTLLQALSDAGYGWEKSVRANPHFVDSGNGNFHLKSKQGYLSNATWVADALTHSIGIDFGCPDLSVGDEPLPNGGRINVGLYGGTAEASKSLTNAWLQVLSYSDGGTLNAEAAGAVYWTGGNYPTGATVSIYLSKDAGVSWIFVTNGLDAALGSYAYEAGAWPDGSAWEAQWKVVLDQDVNVYSATERTFMYRQGSYIYYVNDAYNMAADVYCTAAGNDSNSGVSPGSPKASLQAVLSAYTLGEGDIIYVDTGDYTSSTSISFINTHGTLNAPIRIVGSTNRMAGGSRLYAPMTLTTSSHFLFEDLVFASPVSGAKPVGISISGGSNIVFRRVEARDRTTAGFSIAASAQNITLSNCVAHGGAVGLSVQLSTNVLVRHCVFYENSSSGVSLQNRGHLTLENIVVASEMAGSTLLYVTNATLVSDYNALYAGNHTQFGNLNGTLAENHAQWMALSALDAHSIPKPPLFADPTNYDYHLQTMMMRGRVRPDGTLTSDSQTSALIDAGNPSDDMALEPGDNGGRVNIGLYGGTPEASQAPNAPWLIPVTFADAGGVTQNGDVVLRWLCGGGITGTVQIDFSRDGGNTWQRIANGVPATNEMVVWNVHSGVVDTPAALWRVTSEVDNSIEGMTGRFFAIRRSPLKIYVNNYDTNDTIYTIASGNAENWLATPDAPQSSLANVFDIYDLEAGDEIYVDSGLYSETQPVDISLKTSGSASAPIKIIGNTNAPFRMTVLMRTSRSRDNNLIEFNYAKGIHLQAIVLSNMYMGIYGTKAQDITLEQVRVTHAATSAVFFLNSSTNIVMQNSMVKNSSAVGLEVTNASVSVQNSLFLDNQGASILVGGGSGNLQVTDSILEASSAGNVVYRFAQTSATNRLSSDYNNIRALDGANIGILGSTSYRYLYNWQNALGKDMHSAGFDPLFADVANEDYHLQSEFGRYRDGAWLIDEDTSKLIDLGSSTTVLAEPVPNGNRLNIGLYGGTAQASKSPVSGQQIIPLTMSDGGVVRGDVTLAWSYNGFLGNEFVLLSVSVDGGASWIPISTNYIDQAGVVWVTTNYQSTAMALWKVELVDDPNIGAETEIYFSIKNDPLAYYVNDASTNGDVYCSAPGNARGTGLSPDDPINSLAQLFRTYQIDAGDTIYVDTGTYELSSTLTIELSDASATNMLLICGNPQGGTVFTNRSETAILQLENAHHVHLRDIELHGGRVGLILTRATQNRIEAVRSIGATYTAFEFGQNAGANEMLRCVALNFMRTGVVVAIPIGSSTAQTNTWQNGIVFSAGQSTTGCLVLAKSGRLNVTNSVFVANGNNDIIFDTVANTVYADYNNFHRGVAGVQFARHTYGVPYGLSQKVFHDLDEWRAGNAGDGNSFEANPLFADGSSGNFYPLSRQGRYNPETGAYIVDAYTSPLIDLGNPASIWANESSPNGGVINLGIYGNTSESSLTPTNSGRFVLMTLADGGSASGQVTLRWKTIGNANLYGQTVQVSLDGGNSWITPPSQSTAGSYIWNADGLASTHNAKWRVVSGRSDLIPTEESSTFTLHNKPFYYYVNDENWSSGDYCTAAGYAGNTGLSPDSPLESVASVLNKYRILAGDVIFVDNGTYPLTQAINMSGLYGTVATPIVIQGGTNAATSRTVFNGAGIHVQNSIGIQLRDIQFSGQTRAGNPVELQWTEGVSIKNVDVYDSRGDGMYVVASSNTVLQNILLTGAVTNGLTLAGSYATRIEHATIWSNPVAQISLRRDPQTGGSHTGRTNCFVSLSNSVLGSFGQRIPIFSISGYTLYADYNNLRIGNNALVAIVSGQTVMPLEYDSVSRWAQETSNDLHSLSHEPLFLNARGGDFHLQSAGGRFNSGSWVIDSVTSPQLDAGNPMGSVADEPVPNGGRVNIGRYGATPEASKTPLDSSITLISFNDGGRASGVVSVYWLVRGYALTGTVTISFSTNGGLDWIVLDTVQASAGEYLWDTTEYQTMEGLLRLTTSDGVSVESQNVFSVRNQPFTFYVNDASTAGDVYCAVAGSAGNTGISSNSPLHDLNALLSRYDLEAGDTVLIDTGVYVLSSTAPWRITQTDSAFGNYGEDGAVLFQGSTNTAAGGSIVNASGGANALQLEYVQGVTIKYLTVSNALAGSGISVSSSYDVTLEWITAVACSRGYTFSGGSDVSLHHSSTRITDEGLSTTSSNAVVMNCVFWKPAQGPAVSIGSVIAVHIRNSVFAIRPGLYAYQMTADADVDTDYNAFLLERGGRVFRQTYSTNQIATIYETLGSWSSASGNDLYSYSGGTTLYMNAPDAGDFHLLSTGGRYENGAWILDAVSSPLIDAGDDSMLATNEPAPNGDRINIGLYGGSAEASKTPVESSLVLFSFNSGGVATGAVVLSWVATGETTEHTVQIEVSLDGGSTWFSVASGIAASDGSLTWPSWNYTSPNCLWRISDEQNPTVQTQSELPFVLHNTPIYYYVNDEYDAQSDIYCTAAGDNANSGTSPDTPKASIEAVLDTYMLLAGDIIYVDSGYYLLENPVWVHESDSGAASSISSRQVSIIGNTNRSSGGTVLLSADMTTPLVVLSNAHGIRLAYLEFQGGTNAVEIKNSYYISGEWLRITKANNAVYAQESAELMFSRCAFFGNTGAGIRLNSQYGVTRKNDATEGPYVHFHSGVLWSNQHGVYAERGYATVSNSIMGMVLPNAYGYYGRSDQTPMSYRGDYNSLYVSGKNAGVAGLQNQADTSPSVRTTRYDTVSRLVEMRGHDGHSLAHEPALVAPETGDFHLQSTYGRWNGTQWVIDSLHSPLIDAADPSRLDWVNEPNPNGRRANIGLYGGTSEGSKSEVSGSLVLVSLNDGGAASGEIELRWTARGEVTNEMLCIEYSPDNGITWSNIACGVEASSELYTWNSASYGSSALGLWRIYSENTPAIQARSLSPFILRNGAGIAYFVNDENLAGDIYTTAPGHDENDGLTPDTPMASLQTLLNTYDLDPEDIVYVDVGTYTAGSPAIQILEKNSGWLDGETGQSKYVTICGSTNPAYPTVFQAPTPQSPVLFDLSYTEYIWLRDMTLRGGVLSIDSSQAHNNRYQSLRLEDAGNCNISLSYSTNAHFIQTIFFNATTNAAVIANSSISFENCVVWGKQSAISVGNGANMTVTNCVLRASGLNGRIYKAGTSVALTNAVQGDYNSYVRMDDAILAEQILQAGGSQYYDTVNEWAEAIHGEYRSMSLDPLFVDAGNGDFHPISEAGRYQVVESNGVSYGEWVTDYAGLRSPLIDAGAPSMDYENEPIPNGNIVNIGAYGNTPYASKTPTNTSWIQTISYNAGEVMSGSIVLYWTYGGLGASEPVEIAYTVDNVIWTVLATNTIGGREYVWDTSAIRLIPKLKWRVQVVSTPSIYDISEVDSSVKNGTFSYYVNDASAADDMWCQNVGANYPLASGTNAASPVLTVQEILDNYPVGSGDTIYFDTGSYTDSFRVSGANSGTERLPLAIVGSTNGVVLTVNPDISGVIIQNARYINVSNVHVRGGMHGFELNNVSGITLSGNHISGAVSDGIHVVNGANVIVNNALIHSNAGYGYYTEGNTEGARSISFATVYGNVRGAIYNGTKVLTISNSILCASNRPIVTLVSQDAALTADYNIYCSQGANGIIGTNQYAKSASHYLTQWQQESGDFHSMVMDPLFVNSVAGDFHLQSTVGSYRTNGWVTDAATSWGIDFADPSLNQGEEPSPHGYRANIGAYGRTAQASKSGDTNMLLQVITANDGGVLTNGVALHWLSRGLANGTLVRISYFNGTEWVELTQCAVEDVPFVWISDADPTPEAQWRIEVVSNPSIYSESAIFSHRPSAIIYYVNDTYNPSHDIYTSASGSPTNLGYRANSPMDTVQRVLDRYQLMPGDKIFVDSGVYLLFESIQVSANHSGDDSAFVSIIGNTNSAKHATVLQDQSASTAVLLNPGVGYIQLSHLQFDGFENGISVQQNARNCEFLHLDVCNTVSNAVILSQAQNMAFTHVLMRDSKQNGMQIIQSRDITLDGCVFWSNRYSALVLGLGASVTASNSVFESSGADSFCYDMATNATLVADYNAHYIHDAGDLARVGEIRYESVPQWYTAMRQDRRSLGCDPLFADPENGDFRLQSMIGRYVATNMTWVVDPAHSPLIDAGYRTNNNYANEPAPNGGRINIGLYGNTIEASLSRTNAWVQAVTAMGGGIMSDVITLDWNYGGILSGGETATLEYSPDGGLTWTLITTTVLSNRSYAWPSASLIGGESRWLSSPGAMWRISVLDVSDQTGMFGLRNQPFKYYLNDDNQVGDIWCTAVGDDENLGYWAFAPKRTLSNLLVNIDAEPGDTIYIDTGSYTLNQNEEWPSSDAGDALEKLNVLGSINGTYLFAPITGTAGVLQVEAAYVHMQNLNFIGDGAVRPLTLNLPKQAMSASNLVLQNIRLNLSGNESVLDVIRSSGSADAVISGTNNILRRVEQIGASLQFSGAGHKLLNSVVYNNGNNATGVWANANGMTLSNNTVVTPHGTAISMGNANGTVLLRNNLLVAGGVDGYVLNWIAGRLDSDWNNLLARGDAWVGQYNEKKWERLTYWQQASGQDQNSLALEPLFVTEGVDFHLQSTAGAWERTTSSFIPSAGNSPLLDTGDPRAQYLNEILPNGNRINMGAYGGTMEASLSRVDEPWVQVLSPSDGGVVKGSNVVLRWNAALNQTGIVTLEYWNGSVWIEIVSGISPNAGSYAWDTGGLNLFNVKWRVRDDFGNISECVETFDIRNTRQNFYVNDTSRGYCTASGNDANDGLTPNTPKRTLQAILDTYDLEGGDVVYVDSGTFAMPVVSRIIWSRSGVPTNHVVIQGWTNEFGTLLRQNTSNSPVLDVKASNIEFRYLAFDGNTASAGLYLDRNSNVTVEAVFARNVLTGVDAHATEYLTVKNSGFFNNQVGVSLAGTLQADVVNNTFVDYLQTGGAAISLSGTGQRGLMVKNNIFHLGGDGAVAYRVNGEASQLYGTGAFVDYNLYSFLPVTNENGIQVNFYEDSRIALAETNVGLLMNWQFAISNDYRSAYTDALLVETEATYGLDFHPKSQYGRWATGGTWAMDGETSFAVDHGDPADDYALEPAANGGRINIGMYGNTREASKGDNTPYYETRTVTDTAGSNIFLTVGNTYILVWDAHGYTSNQLVRIEFSNDGGTNWIVIAENIPATLEYLLVEMAASMMTIDGQWKVTSVDNASETGSSLGHIVLRWTDLAISSIPEVVNGRIRFSWEGGVGGREYWILYSDDHGQSWKKWSSSENGPAFIHRNHFTFSASSTPDISYIFEDRTAYDVSNRWYRIIETDIGANVDAHISNPGD